MIRTDNGHKFQARFHCHIKDLGMEHVYIYPGTPHLNGKIVWHHLTDKREFYQMLDCTDDVDLHKKLAQWDYYIALSPYASHMRKYTMSNLNSVC